MNHTQLQQEPETALPCVEASLRALETEDVETPLETSEVASEQSAVVEKLLAVMEQNTRKLEKWNSNITNLFLTSTIIFALLLVIGWISGHTIVHIRSFNHLFLIQAVGSVVGSFLLNKKAATGLTKLDDVRCIGALVEIWNPAGQINYTRNMRRQAETALIRLLPRLKANDAHLLKEHQRAVLRGVLDTDGYKQWGRYYDEVFLLAIIAAFAQMGDWKSFAQIRRLTITAKYASVQKAARECLPFLKDLAQKQAVGETLLRASSAPEAVYVAPETLLRPASPTADAQPETLLRSVE